MTANALLIRTAAPGDIAAIRTVNFGAFKRDDEATLVDRLRADADVLVELVAARDRGPVVGHILFSHLPVRTESGAIVRCAALAPLAVLPAHQRTGIGTALVRAGLDACAAAGLEAVIVLGHPAYYARFGFSAALALPLRAPFSGPSFMALELRPGALRAGGEIRYARAFGIGEGQNPG